MIVSQLSTCEECRDGSCATCKAFAKRKRAREARRAKDAIMRSMGLVKVKGAVSGRTYWE
jgi:hypothetical protein